jgi:hypothetical protein
MDEFSFLTSDCDCQFATSLDQLLPADLIIVYQSHFDEFHRDDIDRAIGEFPMSRWIVGYSPWCESLGHSDKVWPVAWIVPATHIKSRLSAELQSLYQSSTPVPALSSRDEAFGKIDASVFERSQLSSQSLSARITCEDVPFRQTMVDCLRMLGVDIVQNDSADVHIVSIEQWDEVADGSIDAAIGITPRAQMLVVCDLLTHTQRRTLGDRGIWTLSALRFVQELDQTLRTSGS